MRCRLWDFVNKRAWNYILNMLSSKSNANAGECVHGWPLYERSSISDDINPLALGVGMPAGTIWNGAQCPEPKVWCHNQPDKPMPNCPDTGPTGDVLWNTPTILSQSDQMGQQLKIFGRLSWHLAIATSDPKLGDCNKGGKSREFVASLMKDWFDVTKNYWARNISEFLLDEFITQPAGGDGLGWGTWWDDANTRDYVTRMVANNLVMPMYLDEIQVLQSSGAFNLDIKHVALRLLYKLDNSVGKEHYNTVLTVWKCYPQDVFSTATVQVASDPNGNWSAAQPQTEPVEPWHNLPVLQLIRFDATEPPGKIQGRLLQQAGWAGAMCICGSSLGQAYDKSGNNARDGMANYCAGYNADMRPANWPGNLLYVTTGTWGICNFYHEANNYASRAQSCYSFRPAWMPWQGHDAPTTYSWTDLPAGTWYSGSPQIKTPNDAIPSL